MNQSGPTSGWSPSSLSALWSSRLYVHLKLFNEKTTFHKIATKTIATEKGVISLSELDLCSYSEVVFPPKMYFEQN